MEKLPLAKRHRSLILTSAQLDRVTDYRTFLMLYKTYERSHEDSYYRHGVNKHIKRKTLEWADLEVPVSLQNERTIKPKFIDC